MSNYVRHTFGFNSINSINSNNSINLINSKPKCTNRSQPNVSDEDSFKNAGMSGSAQSLDEQKQVDMDSDTSSSPPSNSNLFSIFNKSISI